MPDTSVVPWASTGWTNNRNVTQMLEFLLMRGEVAIAGRVGRERLWDLAGARLSGGRRRFRRSSEARAAQERAAARLARHRPAEAQGDLPMEPGDVGEAGEPAVVEGIKGEWRVDPAALGDDFEGPHGAALALRPARARPRPRRRSCSTSSTRSRCTSPPPSAAGATSPSRSSTTTGWSGSSTPPPTARPRVLNVHAIHEDVKLTRAMTKAVQAELDDLASWLGLGAVDGPPPRR